MEKPMGKLSAFDSREQFEPW